MAKKGEPTPNYQAAMSGQNLEDSGLKEQADQLGTFHKAQIGPESPLAAAEDGDEDGILDPKNASRKGKI
ncbi:MAG: hypothetical protein EOO40_05640 [Deltaproteobacteria bacterium]|nr:MAG: hypothetical protein EOO40_05640 [Deltaproteobacteria bacterium]